VSDNGIELIAAAIQSAEDIFNPLDGLLDRAAADPGACFEPAVIERLAELKRDNPSSFERLRANLKSAGCRVTALDQAIKKAAGTVDPVNQKQADALIDLASSAELFHAPDRTGYADVEINGHRETFRIRSSGFRRWLSLRYYQSFCSAPNSEAMASAINMVEAKADFDGVERTVYTRVGALGGRLYLDLGDDGWRAIEIDSIGWRVIDDPPVRFRRSAGMKPLPMPAKGGSIHALRSFLNVKSKADFVLVVAWALAVLRNRGPYPLLVLSGEQGSAKSTFTAMLRALLDPNTAPL
jgi:hypothetical protein